MKGKEDAPLNRRLMAGLIACLLLIVALAVAGGVAFSGVLWYREQLEELQNANQKTAEELQQRAEEAERAENLVGLMDGYFNEGGHHINVNVLNREVLLDAMDHPEFYPQLTIRVSGYAVNFIKLSREQQMDVINRTFHTRF